VDIPEELRQVYRQVGGTPHLDTQYTVFGEVVEGLDVALRIQKAETDDNASPVTDIHIVKAYVAGEE
jgi:peptidyl-prolyl cis-trans isomerase B (cyclophilin B)